MGLNSNNCTMNYPGTSLRELCFARKGKRKRESSYDRTGGNFDFYTLIPGQKKRIFDVSSPGCITHIWITAAAMPPQTSLFLERKLVIRMYWDGETNPSVEAPLGDFFGMGHGISKNFVSAPLAMSPQDGRGYNCYFPMPYSENAKIDIENEGQETVILYFYIDFEEYEEKTEGALQFHARWRRELTRGVDDKNISGTRFQMEGKNLTGDKNYLIMEARGKGHYVGCNLNIHNLRFTDKPNWYGEGDDMIFIDDEPWPPRLHGTGCEDYFNTAFCPLQEYNAPYHGVILVGGPNWSGKATLYRYHIQDPIMFEKSIRVTIEHGHNNSRSDDYSSTAYWYQTEPHMDYKAILPASERLPVPEGEVDFAEIMDMKAERDAEAENMGLKE